MEVIVTYILGLCFFSIGIFLMVKFYRTAILSSGPAHDEFSRQWPRAIKFLRVMVPIIILGFGLNAVICILYLTLALLRA